MTLSIECHELTVTPPDGATINLDGESGTEWEWWNPSKQPGDNNGSFRGDHGYDSGNLSIITRKINGDLTVSACGGAGGRGMGGHQIWLEKSLGQGRKDVSPLAKFVGFGNPDSLDKLRKSGIISGTSHLNGGKGGDGANGGHVCIITSKPERVGVRFSGGKAGLGGEGGVTISEIITPTDTSKITDTTGSPGKEGKSGKDGKLVLQEINGYTQYTCDESDVVLAMCDEMKVCRDCIEETGEALENLKWLQVLAREKDFLFALEICDGFLKEYENEQTEKDEAKSASIRVNRINKMQTASKIFSSSVQKVEQNLSFWNIFDDKEVTSKSMMNRSANVSCSKDIKSLEKIIAEGSAVQTDSLFPSFPLCTRNVASFRPAYLSRMSGPENWKNLSSNMLDGIGTLEIAEFPTWMKGLASDVLNGNIIISIREAIQYKADMIINAGLAIEAVTKFLTVLRENSDLTGKGDSKNEVVTTLNNMVLRALMRLKMPETPPHPLSLPQNCKYFGYVDSIEEMDQSDDSIVGLSVIKCLDSGSPLDTVHSAVRGRVMNFHVLVQVSQKYIFEQGLAIGKWFKLEFTTEKSGRKPAMFEQFFTVPNATDYGWSLLANPIQTIMYLFSMSPITRKMQVNTLKAILGICMVQVKPATALPLGSLTKDGTNTEADLIVTRVEMPYVGQGSSNLLKTSAGNCLILYGAGCGFGSDINEVRDQFSSLKTTLRNAGFIDGHTQVVLPNWSASYWRLATTTIFKSMLLGINWITPYTSLKTCSLQASFLAESLASKGKLNLVHYPKQKLDLPGSLLLYKSNINFVLPDAMLQYQKNNVSLKLTPYTEELATFEDINNYGTITLKVLGEQGKGDFLLPGDASYHHIDQEHIESLAYLFSTHHGSLKSILSESGGVLNNDDKNTDTDIPKCRKSSKALVFFSYLQGNVYGYDMRNALDLYRAKGWKTGVLLADSPGYPITCDLTLAKI